MSGTAQRYSWKMQFAYAWVWAICAGLRPSERKAQYDLIDATLQQMLVRERDSLRELTRAVLTWAKRFWRDSDRWEWTEAYERSADRPVLALVAITLIATAAGLTVVTITGSATFAVGSGVIVAVTVAAYRMIRLLGRTFRTSIDESFRIMQTHAEQRLLTVPNVLSTMRLCAGPALLGLMAQGKTTAAFALVVAAGVSDALDGPLARRLKQVTIVGQRLDPAADRISMLLAGLGLLIWSSPPPAMSALLVLMIARDLLVLGGGAVALLANRFLRKPNKPGKIASIMEMSVLGLLYAEGIFYRPSFASAIEYTLCAGVLIVGTVSLRQYQHTLRYGAEPRPFNGTEAIDTRSHDGFLAAIQQRPACRSWVGVYERLLKDDYGRGDPTSDPYELVERGIALNEAFLAALTESGDIRGLVLEELVLLRGMQVAIMVWRS